MPSLITFPPHALQILEERLKEHQGLLSHDADVTELALRVLALAAIPGRSGRTTKMAEP